MRNFKHSIIAAIAVAMIGSLAAAQASDLQTARVENEQRINAAVASQNITIAEKDITEDFSGVSEIDAVVIDTPTPAPEINEEEIASKSQYPIGYVLISSDSLNVRETPSDESAVIDQLEVCTEVSVMENTEGWYKIAYADGKTGYVTSDSITQDKQQAEDAKKSYTHYKIAQVTLEGNSVRVREKATTDSDIITELDDGTYVYMLWTEDDFIRVCYGSEYKEGYVINTSLQFIGEWEEKSTIAAKQKEIADAKAEAEAAAKRAEQIARQNSAVAGKSVQSSSDYVAPASSSKGQAIVNTAMKYLGVPYVWGGTSPSGFDCSGLVQYVCRVNGISVNRVAADQRNNGTYVSRENLQPGDLVFFAKGGSIHHVGIYIGNGNMIHAPQTGDVVKISSINTQYRISQYAGAVRVY